MKKNGAYISLQSTCTNRILFFFHLFWSTLRSEIIAMKESKYHLYLIRYYLVFVRDDCFY